MSKEARLRSSSRPRRLRHRGGFVQGYAATAGTSMQIDPGAGAWSRTWRPIQRATTSCRRQGRVRSGLEVPGRPGSGARLCQGQGRRLHRGGRSRAGARRVIGHLQVASRRRGPGGSRRFRGGGVQFRPFFCAGGKRIQWRRAGGSLRRDSAPTIVNSWEFEDARTSPMPVSCGFSAAILSGVSLDVAGSRTMGKKEGEKPRRKSGCGSASKAA